MKDTALQDLAEAAEEAVDALEKLDVGAAVEAQTDAAREAVEELKAEATATVFPGAPTPIGADLEADLGLYTEALPTVGSGPALADLHAASADSYPELAAVLRGPVVARRLVAAAKAEAARHARRDADQYAAECLDEFRQTVAGQLVGDPDFRKPAEILAQAVPALERRISSAVHDHQAHADELEAERAREIAARRARIVGVLRDMNPNLRTIELDGASRRPPAVIPMVSAGSMDRLLDELEDQLRRHFANSSKPTPQWLRAAAEERVPA